MDANYLLGKLPPFNNSQAVIKEDQSVHDIIKEVLNAHDFFAKDYDNIAEDFYRPDIYETCEALFNFCKQNIRYRIESEKEQTTRSPSALIAIGDGDCKHYAGFIGGVLDALNREGANINWVYRFASYKSFDKEPQHVFVVVKEKNGNEIWVDPVLKEFDERLKPDFFIDKKVKMLSRVSGPDTLDISTLDAEDQQLPAQLLYDIQKLLHYGVLNMDGSINDYALNQLANQLPADEYTDVLKTVTDINAAATIGGLFSTIVRGIKKIAFFVPREAFKGLVLLNVFGYATKLQKINTDTDGHNKLYHVWNDIFGGDWSSLENAFKSGANKKAILGTPAAAAAPAWLLAAAGIIAAIAPIISSILAKMQQQGTQFTPAELQALNMQNTTGTGLMAWIKANPILAAGIGFGVYMFVIKPMIKKTA